MFVTFPLSQLIEYGAVPLSVSTIEPSLYPKQLAFTIVVSKAILPKFTIIVSISVQPMLFVTVTIYSVLTVGDTVCDAPEPKELFHWYVPPPVAVMVVVASQEKTSAPAFAVGDAETVIVSEC